MSLRHESVLDTQSMICVRRRSSSLSKLVKITLFKATGPVRKRSSSCCCDKHFIKENPHSLNFEEQRSENKVSSASSSQSSSLEIMDEDSVSSASSFTSLAEILHRGQLVQPIARDPINIVEALQPSDGYIRRIVRHSQETTQQDSRISGYFLGNPEGEMIVLPSLLDYLNQERVRVNITKTMRMQMSG